MKNIEESDEVWIEEFLPTHKLRWVEKSIPLNGEASKKTKVLQQMLIGDRGTKIWEDVPTEKETK